MNKVLKGKKLKITLMVLGTLTCMFFLFKGTILAETDDETLIKIYTDYSDLFKQNDLVSNAFRSFGCGVLSVIVTIADASSGLFEKSFGMIDFTKYKAVQDFIEEWRVVWSALLCVAIGWLGVTLVFSSDKNPKIATNICVGILVVTSMTWMVGKMNTLLSTDVRSEILGTTSTNTVYKTLGNNVHDLRYIDSVVGLENMGSKNVNGVKYADAGTPMNKKIWKAVKINEVVKPDDVKSESKSIVENYKTDIPTADGKVKSTISECYDGVAWTDMLNTYYYRYEINWMEAFLELISIALIYIFFSYKVVRTFIEIVFSEVLAMLYSPNLNNGQKALKIIDGIKDSYIIVMLSLVSIRMYMIATEYISGKSWNGFIKAMFLLFIAFAVIDGPNIVQRITGMDAGMSDGMQKVMSTYYAGGMMAGAARGAAHVAGGLGRTAGKFGKTVGSAMKGNNAGKDALNGMGGATKAGASEAFNSNENNSDNEDNNENRQNEESRFNSDESNNLNQNENGITNEKQGSSDENGKNSIDANANAAGDRKSMDDSGINSINPDNARADALNGMDPLGKSSVNDKTSRMDRELDSESSMSAFNGSGERGILSEKSDFSSKFESPGASDTDASGLNLGNKDVGRNFEAGNNISGMRTSGESTKSSKGMNKPMGKNYGEIKHSTSKNSGASERLKKDVLKKK